MKITRVLKTTIAAAVIAGALLLAPSAANAAVFISAGIAPPAIPIYTQPIAPGYGYIWTPGYWAYGDAGYYWVDGAWVLPPYVNALWTPGYWGYGGGGYFWNAGYWGPTIGFYGGINYGFGYFGVGYWGGYWNGGHFYCNSAYNHIGYHNGYVYSHSVAGYENGHPGGASYARGTQTAMNRGSGINGNSYANHSTTTARSNVAYNGGRSAYNGGGQSRGYAGGNSYAQSRGSYSGGSYGGGQSQARSFSSGGNYGGGQARSFSGGGSYGGGGGFHGGGGGGGGRGGGGHR
jgi:hypothetical protein